MKIVRTAIEGMLLLEPEVFEDERGCFLEVYRQDDFDRAIGAELRFVQDNHSRSSRGVLRGLHYQLPPHAQGRLVRVAHGTVFDVAVDIRKGSASFGRWVGTTLSGSNHRMAWLPPGLAHGFLVTSESADFVYKATDYHAPRLERRIRWNDPALAIDWPKLDCAPQLNARDATAALLADAELPG